MSPVLATEHPASAVITAIQAGDVEALSRLLGENPDLAAARIARGRGGHTITLLHVVTDWPGHFPNGPATVASLIEAGGDLDARREGANQRTPLHWAASSGDVEVLDALLDAGADIEAPGAFNGVGGPLDHAVAFGQWPGSASPGGAWCANEPLDRSRTWPGRSPRRGVRRRHRARARPGHRGVLAGVPRPPTARSGIPPRARCRSQLDRIQRGDTARYGPEQPRERRFADLRSGAPVRARRVAPRQGRETGRTSGLA
jgi:hypothetical protein